MAKAPPYAHWSNGVAKRAIETILGRIRRIGPLRRWQDVVTKAEKAYNTTWHSGINSSPQEAMRGITPDGRRLTKEEHLEMVRRARCVTSKQQKKRRAKHELAPPHRKPFKIDDLVSLRAFRRENKPAPEWEGRYVITTARGEHLFDIADEEGSHVGT